MFIYDKVKGYIVNTNEIKDIFLGREPGTVSVGFRDGRAMKLAAYNSDAEAKEAIDILVEAIATSKREVVHMPNREEVLIRLRNKHAQAHHATGKKTKGHGGS